MWISRGYIEHLADADAAGLVVGPSLTRTSLNAVIASQVPEASTSIAGRVRLAGVADAVEGTATHLAVTPAGLAAVLSPRFQTGGYSHVQADWAVQSASVRKIDGQVHVGIKLTGNKDITWGVQDRTFGTLSVGFRPAHALHLPVIVRASSQWYQEIVEIGTAGEVRLKQQAQFGITATAQVFICAVFTAA